MNVFGEKKRSWRKARKRGVSPIIATILLVAITVVLAAVLYVLISGLTTGPGNAPLGSHFGWGSTSNQSGATPTPAGCTATAYCYSIDIASASGITTSSFTLGLKTATGATLTFPTATVGLYSASGGTAIATYSSGTWSSSVSVSGGMTIVISTGTISAKTGALAGDSLVAIGGGSYSGTVTSSAFP